MEGLLAPSESKDDELDEICCGNNGPRKNENRNAERARSYRGSVSDSRLEDPPVSDVDAKFDSFASTVETKAPQPRSTDSRSDEPDSDNEVRRQRTCKTRI